MIETAKTEAEGLLENSLRIDAQFPYFAKNLSDQMGAAMEVIEPLMEILGVSPDDAFAGTFRDAMIEAVEFLNHPLAGPLIADTVQQVCDFFAENYFAMGDKDGQEFSREALKWIGARKDARYAEGKPYFEEKLARSRAKAEERNGAAASDE